MKNRPNKRNPFNNSKSRNQTKGRENNELNEMPQLNLSITNNSQTLAEIDLITFHKSTLELVFDKIKNNIIASTGYKESFCAFITLLISNRLYLSGLGGVIDLNNAEIEDKYEKILVKCFEYLLKDKIALLIFLFSLCFLISSIISFYKNITLKNQIKFEYFCKIAKGKSLPSLNINCDVFKEVKSSNNTSNYEKIS